MGPKLDDELFYKLLKLFLRGFQVTSLHQIHKLVFILELECSKSW